MPGQFNSPLPPPAGRGLNGWGGGAGGGSYGTGQIITKLSAHSYRALWRSGYTIGC